MITSLMEDVFVVEDLGDFLRLWRDLLSPISELKVTYGYSVTIVGEGAAGGNDEYGNPVEEKVIIHSPDHYPALVKAKVVLHPGSDYGADFSYNGHYEPEYELIHLSKKQMDALMRIPVTV